jgi:hypothetical protein
LHVWFGKLYDKFGLLPRILDARVAENLQPRPLRIIHQEKTHAVVHRYITGGEHLAVPLVIGERQRGFIHNVQETWLSTAMLRLRNFLPAAE